MNITYILTGALVVLFFANFFYASIREKKARAAILSLAFGITFGAVYFYLYTVLEGRDMMIPILVVIAVAVLFFTPSGKSYSMKINPTPDRVDERDIMFAREEYEPGNEKYDKYYQMRPEKKRIDDRIRALPKLLHPGGKFYQKDRAEYIIQLFDFNESMIAMVDGEVSSEKQNVDQRKITSEIKAMTLDLGADEVGVGLLDPAWVYSHVGRGPEEWGAPIENDHKYVIAFTLEMDYSHVERGPRLPITEETAVQYMHGAIVSIKLAEYIRGLGYPARAQIAGSNYQVMMPAVAHDAGLGELGRHGYLISPRYGSRVRLGAVTTDLPLMPDRPIRFGVQEFCRICKKCADNCPPAAIPKGDRENIRGVEKWQLKMEQCIYYWRLVGSDCGMCMKVCPFSHPKAIVHDIIRAGIKHSAIARRLSLWGDDLFYGRKGNY